MTDACCSCRAEQLEIFDEFEEWHMIQVCRLAALPCRLIFGASSVTAVLHGGTWGSKASCTVTCVNDAPTLSQDHYCLVLGVNGGE